MGLLGARCERCEVQMARVCTEDRPRGKRSEFEVDVGGVLLAIVQYVGGSRSRVGFDKVDLVIHAVTKLVTR